MGGIALIAISSCSTAPDSRDDSIKPFTSDKCSYYAEGTITQRNLWCHCCVEHDIYYWMGGTEQQRREADGIFKQCIEETGATANAQLMWLGVRLGGGPASNASYRWGFGWPSYRPYKSLTVEEQGTLARMLAGLSQQITTYCSATTDRGSPNAEPARENQTQ